MELLGSLIEWFVVLFDAWLEADFYFRYHNLKGRVHKSFWLLILVQVAITFITSLYDVFSLLGIIISIGCSFCFLLPYKYIAPFRKLLSCILYWVTLMVGNVIVLNLMSLFTRTQLSNVINDFNGTRMLTIILAKTILFTTTRIYIYFNTNDKGKIKTSDAILLFLLPVISAGAITIIMNNVRFMEKPSSGFLISSVILAIGIFASNIIVYYLFFQISENMKLQIDLKELQQRYDYQKKQMTETAQIYEKIRRMKHDVKHHFDCLSGYLQSGDSDGARRYLAEVSDQIAQVYSYVNTDCPPLNFIINTKLARAQEMGIDVQCEVDVMRHDHIPDTDLCALLGNLLDNAIEASEKESDRFIHLRIFKQRGYCEYLVQNRISSSVLEKNPELHSSKPGNNEHGLGLRQVRLLTDKLDGFMDVYEKNGMFSIRVMIPMTGDSLPVTVKSHPNN